MPKYLVEFIGTFFLVLIVALCVKFAVEGAAPLAIGVGLAVLVYAGGHISGAHYNPAVTFGAALTGKTPPKEAVIYIGVQMLGAILAASLARVLGTSFIPAPNPQETAMVAFLCEAVFSFLLVFTVLQVATHPAVKGNSFYGFAIGGAVMTGAYAVGVKSGAVFNPAVGIGSLIAAVAAGETVPNVGFWLYLVGPLTGGLLAALAFKVTSAGAK